MPSDATWSLMDLGEWQDRLHSHFTQLREVRDARVGDKPLFVLEHGLGSKETNEIAPARFYRRKAAQIREFSKILVQRHGGKVPSTIDSLLELPGVGRKTANLVVTLGFAKPGICVDIHVHRITNRLRWVRTRHPDETERALRDVLPSRHWIPINEILVRHGQQVCRPISPICSVCPVEQDCPKQGVGRRR